MYIRKSGEASFNGSDAADRINNVVIYDLQMICYVSGGDRDNHA